MTADIAQEFDIIQTGQPVGVIEHPGVGRTFPEGQKPFEDPADRGLVCVDLLDRQELAAFVLARGVPDTRRAAAHQGQRTTAAALQPGQHHDWQERADMQRGRRAVEADIGG